MKKKIAILTQPLGTNYGGILQNYALQQILIKLGYNPITINRINVSRSWIINFLAYLRNETLNKIRGKYIPVFTKKDREKVFKNLYCFVEQSIQNSKQIEKTSDLKKYFDKEDFYAVIVGSDQTWRPKYSPKIENYFLDFLKENNKIIKLAYATSFGTDKWEFSEPEKEICKSLAQNFNSISVREKTAIDICKNKFNVEAELVLDPTLLLNKEDYIKLLNLDNNIKSGTKSLFYYVLDNAPKNKQFITDIEKKNIFKIQSIQATAETINTVMPSVREWILSFYNNDIVITDSFHGTVFSIIFNKPFFSVVNKERGASRFESLLGLFGLENRLIYDVENFDINRLNEPIDFNSVNKKLEVNRLKSLKFLTENLKND
ncbi:polysaccharide pyruvyl transferase family protein [Empedobacter falsenii]|uniref:polysaccharide pyruvyl transferase family protein n=1 Tax=Empedobacter falsenii TaxID=343874 RepID=UPI003A801551